MNVYLAGSVGLGLFAVFREFILFTYLFLIFYFILFYYFFLLFRATLIAYGSSQVRGQIGATATGTAMQDPSGICDLYHSSRQRWVLNPLSEARDQTHILMNPSQICYR